MGYILKFLAIILFVLSGSFGSYQLSADAAVPKKIVVNIPSRTLSLYENGQVVKEYPVGIGRAGRQTPLGSFQIYYKEMNPTWIEPTYGGEPVTIPSGPDNPLGYRWMEFAPLYGIHGTNRPESVGWFVSNGCIRMLEEDVEELYEKVNLGMPLEITYERFALKQAADKSLSLHIYPDHYALAPLKPDDIYAQLAAYNASDLVGAAELRAALCSSESSEFNLGRMFSLEVDGKKIAESGYCLNGEAYIPVNPVVAAANVDAIWDRESGLLRSRYGSVPGLVRNDRLYVARADLYKLFHLYFSWHNAGTLMSLSVTPKQLSKQL